MTDEHLTWLINQRMYKNSDSPNKKAFKAILKERGNERNDYR